MAGCSENQFLFTNPNLLKLFYLLSANWIGVFWDLQSHVASPQRRSIRLPSAENILDHLMEYHKRINH